MLNLGILISGSGTNLEAIIQAIKAGAIDAEVKLVISSRPDAYGLKRAGDAGIPTIALSREAYADPLQADVMIAQALRRAGIDLVVMAGYMRMVHAPILDAYPSHVLNIHPALLPAFKGAHAIQEAFDYGVKVTGVTVHVANAEYDAGRILAQQAVAVMDEDTLETLEKRIHDTEHRLYPLVLQQIASGEIKL
ncbi:MAG: phosphoribosylglycinamide formyltransferase [Coriobacteriales bacterium]|jgi:phosphoribosylglycinamide formyltransferase-1|nr:phosphoribosylglycinamide formyltransferase [Coriobacteriales bacterium]